VCWFKFFVKIVNLFKRWFTIFWKLWTSFPKASQILKLFLLLKIVFLVRLSWGLIQIARTNLCQNLSRVSFKNILLFCRNNCLKYAFIAWKCTTLLNSAELSGFLFLKVFWNWFLRFLRFLLTSLDPHSQGDQILLLNLFL